MTINGNEYGETRIVGVSVSGGLFDAPGVGDAVARTLELNIMPLEAPFGLIPPMSEIRCFVRLVSADGQRVSEYIQKGVFYADTVTRDSDTGMASVTAFDAIMRMDQLFGKTACTVTYDDGFGNIQKFECDVGDAMPIPETPSNPERLFLGWTPAPESVVLHDALYVAQWDSRRVITSGVSSSYNFRYWLFDNNEGIIEALRAGPVGGYGNPRIYAKTLRIVGADGGNTINSDAFGTLYSINNLIISEGFTSIGYHSFYYCDGLKNILLPKSLISIGDSAFDGCKNIRHIFCRGNRMPTVGGRWKTHGSLGDAQWHYNWEGDDVG